MKQYLRWSIFGLLALAGVTTCLLALSAGHPRVDPSEDISDKGHGTVAAQPMRAAQSYSSRPDGLAGNPDARHASTLDDWAASIPVADISRELDKLVKAQGVKFNSDASRALLSSWASRDISGALNWFGDRGGADQLHQQARDLLAHSLAGNNPAKMFDWMQSALPPAVCSEILGPFFRQWSQSDPAAAATMLTSLSGDASQNPGTASGQWSDLAVQVAAEWADNDVRASVIWVQSLPDSATRTKALVQIGYNWAETAPADASAFAAQVNDPQLLRVVASQWSGKDPAAASAWADKLPDGPGRTAAIVSLTSAWAQHDPAAAATYASSLPPGDAQNQASLAAASAWAFTQPAQTAQWVGQFPEGQIREQGISQLMNIWATADADAASTWLDTLPPAPSRDSAIDSFSNAITGSYPQEAFTWAQQISNEFLRNGRLQTIAQAWLQTDPAGAQASIRQSSLPQAVKSQLLGN